ncbi:Uncharacterised protein [Mycobacteroides abscessus subsp. abscessus]|nr:Uncharacterised protein [Mycobacteroides abscessus subsp. abscessus]
MIILKRDSNESLFYVNTLFAITFIHKNIH